MVADVTVRKRAEAALANVSRKLIEAQEQERARIGRELHDDIGQRLALLAAELQQLQDNPLMLPEVRSRMDELEKQISEIASDIQLLSHELHSAKLHYLGLAGAVRGFCREFSEKQKVGDRRPNRCAARSYRRTFLFASSGCCKRPCTILQNTVGSGTSKCDCGGPVMRYTSRSRILVWVLTANRQSWARDWDSSAWKND